MKARRDHTWQNLVVHNERGLAALLLLSAVEDLKILRRHGVQFAGHGVISFWPTTKRGKPKQRISDINRQEAIATFQTVARELPDYLDREGIADGDAACSRLGVERIEA